MTTKIQSLIVISLAMLATLPSAQAAESASKPEVAGVGTGAVIGGTIAGPVGMIIGAAIGGHYGHTLDQTRRRETANQALSKAYVGTREQYENTRRQLARIEEQLMVSREQINSLNTEIDELSIERALISELQFDVHFGTDAADLTETDQSRLRVLAELLKRLPEARVDLRGYSDERGTADYNDTLSLDRAFAVADVLNTFGIESKRINTYAFGETRTLAITGKVDDYGQDRRVNIQIDIDGEPAGEDKISAAR